MNIFVSGLVNVETTFGIDSFPVNYYPIDYPFFGIHTGIGGVGYNVAKALTMLGDDVSLVSFAGNDFESDRIEKTLAEDGISAEHISRTLKATPVSLILYDKNGQRQIHCDLKDIQDKILDCASVLKQITDADIVAACNINFNRSLLEEAKRQHKIIATDVHVLSDVKDEYNSDFLKFADIIFLSDEQLPCAPELFMRQLKDLYGMKLIILGRGANGAYLYDRASDCIYSFEAVRQEHIVNTVGAGDALFSSFLHYYAAGFTAEASLKHAELFASVKIGSDGAAEGFLTEKALETLYKKTEIKISKI